MHWGYVRWSSDEQSKGDSERRQLQGLHDYASRHDLQLPDDHILIDSGLSAFTGDNVSRGKLGQFLKDVDAGKIAPGTCLITEDLDRLSRQNIGAATELLRNLMRAGIDVHTIKNGHVYRAKDFGIMDYMLSGMGAYLSNLQSAKKRDRLTAVWEAKRKNIDAEKLTARCPEWLELSKDRTSFKIDEERERIVQSIFTDAANGLGCYTIVRRLNEKRIPPFGAGRRNKQGVQGWHSSSILKILTNRAVLGEFQPYRRSNGKREKVGEVHKDYYPPIIDEELFLRAEAAREGRRIKSAAVKKGPTVANLFSGLLKCAYGLHPVWMTRS
jgi:DNA invertase Pin-like site-specific DNA recombinase